MKKILLVLIIGFITACQQHQPKSAPPQKTVVIPAPVDTAKVDTLAFDDQKLAALVQETATIFEVFNSTNPRDKYDLNTLKLKKSILAELKEDVIDSPEHTVFGSSITYRLAEKITTNLVRILNWKNIDNYELDLLLKDYLSVVKSPDQKFFFFDGNTGGSAQGRVSVVHYNPGDGIQPQTYDAGAENSIFDRNGYSTIDTLHTANGVKYLLMGEVIGCNTCISHYVDLVHFSKDKCARDFNYSIDGRFGSGPDMDEDSPSLTYDAKLHQINIIYTTDDLLSNCNCGVNGATQNDGGKKWDYKNPEDVNCRYAFNGDTFRLINKKVKAARKS